MQQKLKFKEFSYLSLTDLGRKFKEFSYVSLTDLGRKFKEFSYLSLTDLGRLTENVLKHISAISNPKPKAQKQCDIIYQTSVQIRCLICA